MSRKWHDEKQFGRVVGLVFMALGGWTTWRGTWPTTGPVAFALGLLLVVLALLAPRALVHPRRAWMALAEALGFVSTRVILGVVFVGLVTPIGLMAKLCGRDPLGRRAPRTGSRWYPYPTRQHNPKHFEKMY